MTFGGGYAMLPILQRELVEARHWVTEEELTDYFAIGQCTPAAVFQNQVTGSILICGKPHGRHYGWHHRATPAFPFHTDS